MTHFDQYLALPMERSIVRLTIGQTDVAEGPFQPNWTALECPLVQLKADNPSSVAHYIKLRRFVHNHRRFF